MGCIGTIELEGMEFSACHGCLEWEKITPRTFIVDFRAEYDFSSAELSDSLEDTLDYAAIYEIVAGEMSIHSDLLEHLAGRIADAIRSAFPKLGAFSVRVSKMAPPVPGKASAARVTVYRDCR